MDKKDEVNEKVELKDSNYDSSFMGNNSQTDSENEDNVLLKITQTDRDNNDNCLRKDSQTFDQIDSFRKKLQNNNDIDVLRKGSQIENEILRIVKTLSKDDEVSKKETSNKDNNDNNDKNLRKNSQTIDRIGSHEKKSQTNDENGLRKNSQAVDKDNINRNTETKNKGNLIKIDVNHTQLKSNVKPFYKKQETKDPGLKPQIKAVNGNQSSKKTDCLGHRKRVIDRFKEGGIKALQDNEILEMILFYTIKYIDTKPIAYELLKEFGSIEKVFSESYERILSVINRSNRPTEQERKNSALFIKFIRSLAVLLWDRGCKNKFKEKLEGIKSGAQLLEYLKEYYNKYLETDMRDLSHEQFRVIFLNSNNIIIKDEVMFEGTVNQTGVYPRQILKRALELNATAIIAIHNHPGGSLKPSNADISVTRTLQSACDTLGISLLDHLIIGDKFYNGDDQQKSFYSFAENGLL